MNDQLFFLLLRLSIGASMLGHGFVRIPQRKNFGIFMVTQFEKTMLPKKAVLLFSNALPFLEFSVGVLLLLGLFTQIAALVGGMMMVVLIIGTSITEKWEALPSQLIHSAFYAALLYFIRFNGISVDGFLKS